MSMSILYTVWHLAHNMWHFYAKVTNAIFYYTLQLPATWHMWAFWLSWLVTLTYLLKPLWRRLEKLSYWGEGELEAEVFEGETLVFREPSIWEVLYKPWKTPALLLLYLLAIPLGLGVMLIAFLIRHPTLYGCY